MFLLVAGLMTGFFTTLAFLENMPWLFPIWGVFFCLYIVWEQLHNMPLGRLKGNPLNVIKFAIALALHKTVLETPEVSISDKTLRVGQEFTILYQQHFSRPVALTRFTIALVFHEKLFQGAGEDGRVDTAECVVKILERSHEDIPGGLFYDKRSFTIPEDGIPSFTNSLKRSATHSGKWLVRMRIEVAGLPAFMNEYQVFVRPEGASKSPRPLKEGKGWIGPRYKLL